MLNLADPSGYTLFVVMSVLVSISFAPILLVRSEAPAFQATKRMTLVAALPHLAARLRRHLPARRRAAR